MLFYKLCDKILHINQQKEVGFMSDKKEHDFLEIAKKRGKIRNVQEAFKDYPVEEEWHQGRIETIFQLKEVSEEYYLY